MCSKTHIIRTFVNQVWCRFIDYVQQCANSKVDRQPIVSHASYERTEFHGWKSDGFAKNQAVLVKDREGHLRVSFEEIHFLKAHRYTNLKILNNRCFSKHVHERCRVSSAGRLGVARNVFVEKLFVSNASSCFDVHPSLTFR